MNSLSCRSAQYEWVQRTSAKWETNPMRSFRGWKDLLTGMKQGVSQRFVSSAVDVTDCRFGLAPSVMNTLISLLVLTNSQRRSRTCKDESRRVKRAGEILYECIRKSTLWGHNWGEKVSRVTLPGEATIRTRISWISKSQVQSLHHCLPWTSFLY